MKKQKCYNCDDEGIHRIKLSERTFFVCDSKHCLEKFEEIIYMMQERHTSVNNFESVKRDYDAFM